MEQKPVIISEAQLIQVLEDTQNGQPLHHALLAQLIIAELAVSKAGSNQGDAASGAGGTAGEQFDLCSLIETIHDLSEDLDALVGGLSALRDLVAVPPHRQLSWRPAPCGVGQWRIYVEGMLSRGWVTKILRGYSVSQVGFDNVNVETKEQGFDLLLKREWSARQAGRAEQALAERRGILEQQAVYETTGET